jgi:hypothetical protein
MYHKNNKPYIYASLFHITEKSYKFETYKKLFKATQLQNVSRFADILRISLPFKYVDVEDAQSNGITLFMQFNSKTNEKHYCKIVDYGLSPTFSLDLGSTRLVKKVSNQYYIWGT